MAITVQSVLEINKEQRQENKNNFERKPARSGSNNWGIEHLEIFVQSDRYVLQIEK